MVGSFDTIDHDLLMRAVEKHVPEKWIRIYIKRWLEAPVLQVGGELAARTCGSPQGAVELNRYAVAFNPPILTIRPC